MEQCELQDFLATGNYLEVEGLIEVLNIKDIEEPLEDNGKNNTQEPKESHSNYTDVDETIWVKSPQTNERKVVLPNNTKGWRSDCRECDFRVGQKWVLGITRDPSMKI